MDSSINAEGSQQLGARCVSHWSPLVDPSGTLLVLGHFSLRRKRTHFIGAKPERKWKKRKRTFTVILAITL